MPGAQEAPGVNGGSALHLARAAPVGGQEGQGPFQEAGQEPAGEVAEARLSEIDSEKNKYGIFAKCRKCLKTACCD